HSIAGTLFEYVQIFVISNGVNTKYFANNAKQSFEQTFFWTNENNQRLTKLSDFANVFLEKCFVSQLIAEGIVLNQGKKIPMVMRPYQFYAVRAIEKRVEESDKNGYIWHTTGSGKTLTSFKVAQNLCNKPEIEKVLFVVDRKDLDTQTVKEFNAFKDGSVEGTDKTQTLVDQLKDPNRKLTVTTIQKLDRAIKSDRFESQFSYLSDKKVILIFDECHRSQFGKTHAKIKGFFTKSQMFGFTGTPIFADNHVDGTTTADVFDQCLHRYIITHAIADENVLGFAVEYVGKYKKRDADVVEGDFQAEDDSDDWIKGIHKREIFESEDRIEKIAKYVVQDWKKKTKKGTFNALFAISSIDALKKYYTYINQCKPEGMTVATVFTFDPNEEKDWLDADIYGDQEYPDVQFSRDFLEGCIADYNLQFGTNFDTTTFDQYYKDLQKRIEEKQIDLTLVVNMLLTGFNAERLNTLYVDKNLRY
ncbi:MAG: type I restriction endonuclease subunit R, partial [Bdellovibrionales bacterium]|nr:type I restriction endonuclease subunit R [Bdellovibrionales bacterium]